MDNLFLYNKILKNYNNTHYPFNLIENIKDNVISTRNEIELEYSKDLNVYKDNNKNKEKNKEKNNIIGKSEKKIHIYIY
jgi:hypothetical protein